MEALLKQDLVTCIASTLDCDAAVVAKLLTAPTKAGAADLALPCFQLAKERKVPPPQIANQLAEAINAAGLAEAAAAGPFLNITLTTAGIAEALIPSILDQGEAALRIDDGADQTVCIDFSSPNIAKHLAFHHIRSTGIGHALSRCYDAAGWDVKRINFLGDWGTAFGRLIAGWKREGLSISDLEEADDPVTFFNHLYVRISQAGKEDDSVAEEAREWSRRCEEDDPEALELWGTIREASLNAAKEIYQLLDIEFDDWNGEAHYRKSGDDIVAELKAADLLQEDDGAQVVDLSDVGMKKPCLILRKDGATLYATRDLAACEDRSKRYNFNRSLYVVDLGQGLHFKEWFAVAKKVGKSYANDLRHVGFGVVQMWNEEDERWAKTATRNGVPMMLMDVLQEATKRARAVIEEKNPELPEEEKAAVAEAVGTGAVLFNDLKNNRKGDVKFKFEDALNMQGDTGPYLQFAHARLCSIERKFADSEAADGTPDWSLLTRDDEKNVLLHISRLADALRATVDNDEPSQLANALLGFAAAISSWLSAGNKDVSARVLGVETNLSATRVRLVQVARSSLGEGLRLLGLRAPERM